jgi:hypothetical protein
MTKLYFANFLNEEDLRLKIFKVEYISNLLLEHTQILNLSLYDQTVFCISFKWRRPPMEDNLIISKGNI